MIQPLFEHRLELAGYGTRALELEGEGPPIVLLHGFGDSADTWRLALAGLARRDRAAIALDLPGFATADRLDPGEPILPQLDAFAAAALRYAAEEHGSAILCGNSLGGAISLRAGEDPGLPLAGIVPVAPAGLEMPRWFHLIEADALVRWLLAAPVPVPEQVVRRVVAQLYRRLAFARPGAMNGDVVNSFTSHYRTLASGRRVLATGRRLLPELADAFRLERVACPVLLVWGDRDRMVTHHGADVVTAALPDTTYVLFEGCGHCPQVEEPERFVQELCAFAEAPAARAA
jgi:pimeloyl-ACP methyl ester carboxylesterase